MPPDRPGSPSSLEQPPARPGGEPPPAGPTLSEQVQSIMGGRSSDATSTPPPRPPAAEPWPGYNEFLSRSRQRINDFQNQNSNLPMDASRLVIGTPVSAWLGANLARPSLVEFATLQRLAQEQQALTVAARTEGLAGLVAQQQAARSAIRFRGAYSSAGAYLAALGVQYLGDRFIFPDDQRQMGTLIADLASPAVVAIAPGPWWARALMMVGTHYTGRLIDHYNQPVSTETPPRPADATRQPAPPAPQGDRPPAARDATAPPQATPQTRPDGLPPFSVAPPPDLPPISQPRERPAAPVAPVAPGTPAPRLGLRSGLGGLLPGGSDAPPGGNVTPPADTGPAVPPAVVRPGVVGAPPRWMTNPPPEQPRPVVPARPDNSQPPAPDLRNMTDAQIRLWNAWNARRQAWIRQHPGQTFPEQPPR